MDQEVMQQMCLISKCAEKHTVLKRKSLFFHFLRLKSKRPSQELSVILDKI